MGKTTHEMTDAEIERRLTLWVLSGRKCGDCDELRANNRNYVVPFPGVWRREPRTQIGWIVCSECKLWDYDDFGPRIEDTDKWIDKWVKRHAAGAATTAPRE